VEGSAAESGTRDFRATDAPHDVQIRASGALGWPQLEQYVMPKTSLIVESLTGYAAPTKHVDFQRLKRMKQQGVNF
jgi:hypothetical protein